MEFVLGVEEEESNPLNGGTSNAGNEKKLIRESEKKSVS